MFSCLWYCCLPHNSEWWVDLNPQLFNQSSNDLLSVILLFATQFWEMAAFEHSIVQLAVECCIICAIASAGQYHKTFFYPLLMVPRDGWIWTLNCLFSHRMISCQWYCSLPHSSEWWLDLSMVYSVIQWSPVCDTVVCHTVLSDGWSQTLDCLFSHRMISCQWYCSLPLSSEWWLDLSIVYSVIQWSPVCDTVVCHTVLSDGWSQTLNCLFSHQMISCLWYCCLPHSSERWLDLNPQFFIQSSSDIFSVMVLLATQFWAMAGSEPSIVYSVIK